MSYGVSKQIHTTILSNEEIDIKAILDALGYSKTIITVDVYADKKLKIVDVAKHTLDFTYEVFSLSYLRGRQIGEIVRMCFLK